MRGASAIQGVLEGVPGAPVRALVIWEPVIPTDVAPPITRVMALIPDRRVAQYWDEGLLMSDEIARTIRADPARSESWPDIVEGGVVWDYVALFPPGARWDDAIPTPAFEGGTVVQVAAELRERLADPAGRRGEDASR